MGNLIAYKIGKKIINTLSEAINDGYDFIKEEYKSNVSDGIADQMNDLVNKGYEFIATKDYFGQKPNNDQYIHDLVDEDTGDVCSFILLRQMQKEGNNFIYPINLISLYAIDKEKALSLGFDENELIKKDFDTSEWEKEKSGREEEEKTKNDKFIRDSFSDTLVNMEVIANLLSSDDMQKYNISFQEKNEIKRMLDFLAKKYYFANPIKN